MKKLLTEMMKPNSSVSSKRIIGSIAYIITLILAAYATIKEIQTPDIITTILITATSLLGIETIIKPIDKNNQQK